MTGSTGHPACELPRLGRRCLVSHLIGDWPFASHGLSPGVIVEKFTVQLRLTGTGVFGNIKLDTPLQEVTVEASAPTFVDAVNRAVHKLSRLLSKQEADAT